MSEPSTDAGAPTSSDTTAGTAVRVQYFAKLREEVGQSEEAVRTDAATVAELYDQLDARHDFSVPPDDLRVAVNDDFADWTTALEANDVVVFIPPVAGG